MEQYHSTIGSVAREMLQNFTRKETGNGAPFWDLRENVAWQHQLVMDACGERVAGPAVYSAVFKILLEIYLAENKEQAEDFLYEIDPCTEVSELTAWLHISDRNMDYLNRVLYHGKPADARNMLAEAHKLYLQDIGARLIEAIDGYILQYIYNGRAAN